SRTAALIENVTSLWERYEFHHATRALVHFCTVDLSSQYIDVCKDALYCEGKTSLERRRIQTVYWKIADVLLRLMSPVMVHTVEEMWGYLPKAPGEPTSAHLALWPKMGELLQSRHELDSRYKLLFRLKAESDRVLDRMRKEKVIGKGYDANVTLGLNAALLKELAQFGTPDALQAELPELLNVSQVVLDGESDHAALQEFEPATDVQGLWVKVVASAEQACVRCYRRTGDVGSVSEHEYLCARCAGVVG
ncbi:MAG: class I tRNA ligase family protein, partial [Planctomycetes bacterium]|nr:class I tRNA ligase family protein [Planctomycetota bacterium]